jgi:hypothetical protein
VEYFVVGQVVRLTHTVLNDSGVPTNPSTISLTITLPDATTTAPTPSNTGTGTFRYDYTTTQAGRHTYRWDSTGPIAPDDGTFEVHGPLLGIISLEDAKAQLNITTTAHDEELRGYIEAVTGVVERETHSVLVRQNITDYTRVPFGQTLILKKTPILSLTSVATVDGLTTWTVGNLHVDPTTGIVSAITGTYPYGYLKSIYVAGAAVIKAEYVLAAKQVIQDLWATKRGTKGAARAAGTTEETFQPDIGFITRRVRQLLGAPGPLVG